MNHARKQGPQLTRDLFLLKRRLASVKRIEAERLRTQDSLQERVKELTCLYAVDGAMGEGLSLDELSERVVESLMLAMHHPELTAAHLALNGSHFSTSGYSSAFSPSLHAEIRSGDQRYGTIQICHLKPIPFLLPFEQNLLNSIACRLAFWLDRLHAETALRENEARFHAVADYTTTGVFVIQGEQFRYVNPAMTTITGYSKQELLTMKYREHTNPYAEEFLQARRAARHRNESPPDRIEMLIRTKAGDAKWVECTVGYVPYEGMQSIIGSVFDVTDRKKAEEELQMSHDQLRAMSARLDSVREEEKSAIAREIHDHFGQELTAIKMDLALLVERLESGEELTARSMTDELRSTVSLVDRSIRTVRQIASGLRPWAIDTLDLHAAVEWQAKEFQKHSGIVCKVYSTIEGFTMNRQRTNALFRIFQEALTNIARHAEATQVTVELTEENGSIFLKVQDNGRGITSAELRKMDSTGIIGMRERTHQLGGTLTIGGVPRKGTILAVEVPVGERTPSPGPSNDTVRTA